MIARAVPVASTYGRLVTFVACVTCVGCGTSTVTPRLAQGLSAPATITVTSPAFGAGKAIPVDHTCDGKDAMPELILSSPPDGTQSLVVIVDDPEASSGPFTHLVAFDLSPDLRRIPGGDSLAGAGAAARYGQNDFMSVRYAGPCPPRGDLHRYVFRVIASDKVLGLPEGATRERVERALDGHILGEGSLVGLFGH